VQRETSLPLDDEPLNAQVLARALGERASRFSLDLRARCDSSNAVLGLLAEHGAAHGTVLACEVQEAGRGRRGRRWLASARGSLAFSLLWRFAPGAPPPMGLSLAVGIAVAGALEAMGAAGLRLKWPNDVQFEGRKLAGILVELLPGSDAQGLAAIIGIGMNLRLPPGFAAGEDFAPAELAELLQPLPDRSTLLAQLLLALDGTLERYAATGFALLRDEFNARDAFRERPVRVLGDPETLSGVCRGVAADGALLLETASGLRRILSGDVSLRPDAGD
jgi:BirA family biotin operon repressor/biotin-[acetyl-CoA-carboxylase] ligase